MDLYFYLQHLALHKDGEEEKDKKRTLCARERIYC